MTSQSLKMTHLKIEIRCAKVYWLFLKYKILNDILIMEDEVKEQHGRIEMGERKEREVLNVYIILIYIIINPRNKIIKGKDCSQSTDYARFFFQTLYSV